MMPWPDERPGGFFGDEPVSPEPVSGDEPVSPEPVSGDDPVGPGATEAPPTGDPLMVAEVRSWQEAQRLAGNDTQSVGTLDSEIGIWMAGTGIVFASAILALLIQGDGYDSAANALTPGAYAGSVAALIVGGAVAGVLAGRRASRATFLAGLVMPVPTLMAAGVTMVGFSGSKQDLAEIPAILLRLYAMWEIPLMGAFVIVGALQRLGVHLALPPTLRTLSRALQRHPESAGPASAEWPMPPPVAPGVRRTLRRIMVAFGFVVAVLIDLLLIAGVVWRRDNTSNDDDLSNVLVWLAFIQLGVVVLGFISCLAGSASGLRFAWICTAVFFVLALGIGVGQILASEGSEYGLWFAFPGLLLVGGIVVLKPRDGPRASTPE
jgi:hypothetical protein